MWPWLLIQLSSGAAVIYPDLTRAVDVMVTSAAMAIDVQAHAVSLGDGVSVEAASRAVQVLHGPSSSAEGVSVTTDSGGTSVKVS